MAQHIQWFEQLDESLDATSREIISTVIDGSVTNDSLRSLIAPDAFGVGISVQIGVSCAAQFHHWSRPFEYPWAITNVDLKNGHVVLDAAGGDGILQYRMAQLGSIVVNMDLSQDTLTKVREGGLYKRYGSNIILKQGDLCCIPYPDAMFDRVMCVSVLEHVANPLKVADELWRVLKPGGRLVVTLDMAETVRYNHTIDMGVVTRIAEKFDMWVPNSSKARTNTFDEINPSPNEKKTVDLKVLCFYCDKE